MPRPKKQTKSAEPVIIAAGRSSPRTLCPFSGKELSFVQTAAGWQVRAPGWVGTTFYQTKEQAQWDFSFDMGFEPKYVPFWKRVSVGEELEPPTESVKDRLKSAEKMIENIADQAEKGFD